MASFDSNDPREDAFGESDPLWQLLGQARCVEASPYFVRKVMRAIEADPEPRAGWLQFFLRSFVPAAVCAGIAIMAIAGIRNSADSTALANADIEFETIQNLDLLVSNYESSLWLDPSLPSR